MIEYTYQGLIDAGSRMMQINDVIADLCCIEANCRFGIQILRFGIFGSDYPTKMCKYRFSNLMRKQEIEMVLKYSHTEW